MKIRITAMAFTPYGVLDKGTIITDGKIPKDFLIHLVEAAGAAEYLDKDSYETKIDNVMEVKKKALSSQSLPPVKASTKKTLSLPKKKPKSSR